MKILIVDDIAENLDLLEDIFNTYNFSTVRARDGKEAMDCLINESISLIVSDILMPQMDGFQFCAEIKKIYEYKNIPFIFYTAHYYDPEDKDFALKLGADRYFVKPVDINVLLENVNELLQKSKISESVITENSNESETEQKNISLQDYKILKDKTFELGMANEHLMKKNKELIVSHGRYRSLFENASDAIFLLEPKSGTVLDMNQHAEKSIGYSRDEILGMKIFKIDDLNNENDILNKGKIFEAVVQNRNGENIVFEITATFINDSNTGVIQAIARNVTEQRKLKEKLIQTDKLVSLGQLSAGISHEIRNPLQSITINLQLLNKMLVPNSEESETLKSALQGVDRIRKLVDSTLDYVRINKVKEQVESLNEIILKTMPLLQVSLVKKDIEIRIDLSENISKIKADSKEIQQVLINLLTNASEAIKSAGEIYIKTYQENGNVNLLIRDTGEGISQENLNQIFEPFYTKKISGTGLGLSVVKEILDNHNAIIEVTSEIGVGSNFIVKFPIIN